MPPEAYFPRTTAAGVNRYLETMRFDQAIPLNTSNDYVLLHFQVTASGQWTSPEIASPQISVANGPAGKKSAG